MNNQQTNQTTVKEQQQQTVNNGMFIGYELLKPYLKDVKDPTPLKEIDPDTIYLPNGSRDEYARFFRTLSELPEKDLAKLDTTTKNTILIENDTLQLTYDVGSKDKINDGFKPTLEHNEKELVLKDVNLNFRPNKLYSVKLKLRKSLKLGSVVHVPLYHSGFWITLEPMSDTEKLDLQVALMEDLDRIGRRTHTLAFSNHNVIFARTVLTFIKDKIIDTSLSLPDDDDIFKYIKIQDIPIILTAIAKTMYPDGYNYTFVCKNAIVNEKETKLPKCTFTHTAQIDLSRLIWVDSSKLTEEHKTVLFKRASKSVTVEDILKYQDTLDPIAPSTKSFTIEDLTIAIEFGSPDINKYLTLGETFISTLERITNEIIEKSNNRTSDEDIGKLEEVLVNNILLQTYMHFINKIVIDTGVYEEPSDIASILEDLSQEPKIRKEIMSEVNKYINKTLVAIAGIPVWKCPMCGELQTTDGKIKEFVGIDPYMHFFTLQTLQYQNILKKSIETET